MGSRRYESIQRSNFSSSLHVLILCLFFTSLAVFYYLSASALNYLGFGNLVFVDGVTWLNFIDETMKDGLGGLIDIRSSWFLFLLYYPFIVFCKPIFVIILNSFLLAKSASLCEIRVAYFPFILAIPFFVVNSLLPNKELLSLLLSVLFFSALIENKMSTLLMTSLFQMLVRDGVGYAFILVLILHYLKLLNKTIIVIIFLVLILIDKYLIEIQSYFELFVFQRTIGFYDSEGVEWSSFYIRIFANITNLISRVPVLTTEGLVSVTGVSLLLAGFSIFIAALLSLISISSSKVKNNSQIILSYAFIIIMLTTSISPLIQPRYMIPVAIGYLFCCRTGGKMNAYLFIAALAGALSLRFVYYSMNSLPEATNFWPSGFFITY